MKNADQIEFQTVAKRYAQALIELCEKDSVNKEEILANLNMIVETIKESNDLSVVMSAPNISKNAKLNVVGKVFDNKIHRVCKNFILYLVEHDRFNIIENIAFQFKSELDRENNFLQIKIVSAIDLDEETRHAIKDRLSNKLNKQINVDWSVDSDIIAGLVFVIGDSIINTSMKSKLQMIARNITK